MFPAEFRLSAGGKIHPEVHMRLVLYPGEIYACRYENDSSINTADLD
ncbi:MAG: hypothetical protein WDA19_01570 [Mariniphaga sp.]